MASIDKPHEDDMIDLVDADHIELVDIDAGSSRVAPPTKHWRVLVVDDDDDVHQTTRFALGKAVILGRPIELLHAYSAAEAKRILREEDEIAVILVDVVMETPDAGLSLVRQIRGDGLRDLRVVLRTGQPGYAPELSVISEYEIDDYRTKSELTRIRLLTVLTAAIRTYAQIRMIGRNRNGLELIVESAKELFRRTNLELFSRGVLMQIANLLGIDSNGIVGVGTTGNRPFSEARVITGTGRFSRYIGMSLGDIGDQDLFQALEAARESDVPIQKDNYMALCFHGEGDRELCVLFDAVQEILPDDLALLKLFSTNIAIGFDNLSLVERLDRLAFLDPILDVPNLNAFEAALDDWRHGDGGEARMALVNIDSYPAIVAIYGPRVAHGLLEQVYRLLKGGQGNGDESLTVARVADGCLALLGRPRVLDVERVGAAFRRPYVVDGIEIAATATATLIDLNDRNAEPLSIIRTASAALLHVSQTQAGSCVVYDAVMRAAVERRIDLQVGLKRALETDAGLAVHLQPKFDLRDDTVVGAEALLRWTYRSEPVSPAEFIPIAEAIGLTASLTAFVVRTVGRWATSRPDQMRLPVAINLSMTDLNNPDFAGRLLNWLAAEQLTPASITFEVTEGIAMKDRPWAIQQVQALRSAGFRIALDDFGTGYSSLGYISRLPIDTLKIDKSFVAPLDVTSVHGSLAAIIVAMATTLDIECVAEGIETEEQKQVLKILGCRVGQGFLLGRPVLIDEFDRRFAPGRERRRA